MKQCEQCSNKEPDFYVTGCAEKIDEPKKEQHYCLAFNSEEDPIPEEYWADKEKCPFYMKK